MDIRQLRYFVKVVELKNITTAAEALFIAQPSLSQHMANLEQDYPDRTTKPVDSPYPPYADDFSVEQHRFGPFRPIREFYASQKK